MLIYYGLESSYECIRDWYDGYQFGKSDVYCPWDVINYVDLLRFEPDARPRAFWINTSGNEVLRTFLKKTTMKTRRELERLVNGGCVSKKVNEELTCRELYENLDNLWSVLFTTGYLTSCGETGDGQRLLVISNQEIRQIFTEQILTWFQEKVRKDTPKLDAFCNAFREGDATAIESQFNAWLRQTISIRDTGVRKNKKEHFYHGILLGLLSYREDWDWDSNAESGEGYSDILIEIPEEEIGIVIEVKYADGGSLENGCRKVFAQIEEKNYINRLLQDGMKTILKYGIACWKKAVWYRWKAEIFSVSIAELQKKTASLTRQDAVSFLTYLQRDKSCAAARVAKHYHEVRPQMVCCVLHAAERMILKPKNPGTFKACENMV